MDSTQDPTQDGGQVQVAQPVAPVAPAVTTAASMQTPIGSQLKPQQFEQTVEQAQESLTAPTEVPLEERPTEITISIPTQAYFLSGIRDFVVNLTKNMTGFSEQWAYRFQAVVDELCNNAIEHGSKPGELITITLISTKDKSLEVIVVDTGTGKDRMTGVQMKTLFDERRQLTATQYLGFRGRGLPKIVGEWTDEIVFEDDEGGGLRVKVKKYLRKEEDTVSSAKKMKPSRLVLK